MNITLASNPISSTADDHSAEDGETAHVPGIDLADVEMEDAFLPLIPAIIVGIFSILP